MYICEKGYNCCDYQYWDNQENIEGDCDHLVEVESVKHGQWIENHTIAEGLAECSHCNCIICNTVENAEEMYKYCPYCGAKMDEK